MAIRHISGPNGVSIFSTLALPLSPIVCDPPWGGRRVACAPVPLVPSRRVILAAELRPALAGDLDALVATAYHDTLTGPAFRAPADMADRHVIGGRAHG